MKKRPLEGIKVLEITQVLSGPFCGMMLADLGAEVIKVERPGHGELARDYGPYVNDVSLYFCERNRGKKDIAIDLRSDDGKRVIMDIVRNVDIVLENFKNGGLDRLGIGYEEMIKVNPGLIYGSITGFGLYGPLAMHPSYDINAAARAGLLNLSGEDGGPPIKPGFSICDTWAGVQMMLALSMALLHKQRTNKGMRLDVAMLDCGFYLGDVPVLEHSVTGEFAKRTGNHSSRYAPHGEFTACDGNVVIAVTKEEEWLALCGSLGLSALAEDSRFSSNELRLKNRALLVEKLEKATTCLGRYEIEKKLCEAGVPASAVQTVGEFIEHPQTQKLDIIVKVNQPVVGEYLAANTPMQFSKTPVDPRVPAASFPGSHSIEILNSLGYSQEKIEELIGNGAVYKPD